MKEKLYIKHRGYFRFIESNMIVLFFTEEDGVVISTGRSIYSPGHCSNGWYPCTVASKWEKLDDFDLHLVDKYPPPAEIIVTEARKITV